MKILYLHNADLFTEEAHLLQVLFMCNAFSENSCDVILSLNCPIKLNKKNVYDYVYSSFGIKPNFKIILNSSFKMKYNRLGKYFSSSYYRKIIKTVNPDICYIRHHLILQPCIQEKIPYIYEIHNNIFYNRFQFINNYILRKTVKASQEDSMLKIVFISENLKKYFIKKGIDSSKSIVLHDGFNSKFFNKELTQQSAREYLGLPKNKKIVVYAGSLFPDREIGNILKLARNIPEALFIIVGGPQKYVDYFDKIIKEKGLKNVKLTGRKPNLEVVKYLFAADVLLALWSYKVPTINYCSPLKVFEYMAAGRIIVAHGFPTIKEVLRDRKNSLLVIPNNFEDLLKKVMYALTMRYPNEISNNARKDAFAKYSWEMRVKTILDNISIN